MSKIPSTTKAFYLDDKPTEIIFLTGKKLLCYENRSLHEKTFAVHPYMLFRPTPILTLTITLNQACQVNRSELVSLVF